MIIIILIRLDNKQSIVLLFIFGLKYVAELFYYS